MPPNGGKLHNISDYESKKGNIRKIGFHKTP